MSSRPTRGTRRRPRSPRSPRRASSDAGLPIELAIRSGRGRSVASLVGSLPSLRAGAPADRSLCGYHPSATRHAEGVRAGLRHRDRARTTVRSNRARDHLRDSGARNVGAPAAHALHPRSPPGGVLPHSERPSDPRAGPHGGRAVGPGPVGLTFPRGMAFARPGDRGTCRPGRVTHPYARRRVRAPCRSTLTLELSLRIPIGESSDAHMSGGPSGHLQG